jgi:hypothetical protein
LSPTHKRREKKIDNENVRTHEYQKNKEIRGDIRREWKKINE